jgi:hypothetical protein
MQKMKMPGFEFVLSGMRSQSLSTLYSFSLVLINRPKKKGKKLTALKYRETSHKTRT